MTVESSVISSMSDSCDTSNSDIEQSVVQNETCDSVYDEDSSVMTPDIKREGNYFIKRYAKWLPSIDKLLWTKNSYKGTETLCF